jgi:hypothetical protein
LRHFLLVGERMCQVAVPILVPLGRSVLVGLELFLASAVSACGGLAEGGDGGPLDAPASKDVDVKPGDDAPTDGSPAPDASETSTTSDSGANDASTPETSPTASCSLCPSDDYCMTLLNTIPDSGFSSCARVPAMCEPDPTCPCILDATPSTRCYMASCRVTDGGQIALTCLTPPP